MSPNFAATALHRRNPSPLVKRVLPRQRAVFVASDRVERDMAARIVDELKELKGDVNLSEVAKLVQTANEDEIYRALNAKGTEGIATSVADEMGPGLEAGAKIAAKDLGRVAVIDMHRPHLNRWLKQHTGKLIKGIGETSREALRVALRDGVLRGRHPTRLARDLKGQLGLTAPHAKAVARRKAALLANGVPQGRVDQIIGQYTDKLLKHRAQVIAHTESMTAVNRGRFELWHQLVEDGALPKGAKQEWLTSADEMVCPICEPMDGQKRKLGEAFEGSDGSTTDSPPIHPQCRCTVVLID